MYHNVLRLFHDVLLCLTVFYDVQRVAQRSASPHRRPHGRIGDRAAADRLRNRDNAAGIGDNSAEIGHDAAGIGDIAAKVIPC